MAIDTVLSIADEFSEPLLRLSKTALESGSAVDVLNQALEFGKEYVTDYVDSLKESAIGISDTISEELGPSVKDLIGSVGSAGSSLMDVFGASDIASSIADMTGLAFDGSSAFDALTSAIIEQKDFVIDYATETVEMFKGVVDEVRGSLIPSVIQTKDSFVDLGHATKEMLNEFNVETVKAFSIALIDAGLSATSTAKNLMSIGYSIFSIISFIKNFKLKFIEAVSMGAFNKLKDAYIKTFTNVKDAIERSLDDLSITDKLTSMYGEAGKVAKDRAYELANQIGESSRMVTELSAKAAYEGIGTDHFERMMKLADKVGKLKAGETTEGAANTLMSNIKSGQDASSIAQLFGGGQMMERQLRNAGYERALHRGDLDTALDIAEKIAEQAGLTDENYAHATDTLSNNYKKIQNVIENFKQRISEIFANTLAPSVKKVKDFLESDKFKKIQSIVEFIVEKIGNFVNGTVTFMIDHVEWLGIFLGIGIAAKTMLIMKLVSKILFLMSPFRGILIAIGRQLMVCLAHLIKIGLKQTLILIKSKAIAALKVAGPWLLAGAAIAAATYGVYKYLGVSKSFGGWLLGMLAAGYKYWTNVTQNVFVWICEKLPIYFKEAVTIIQAKFFDMLGSMKQKFGDFIATIYEGLAKASSAMGLEDLAEGQMKVAIEAKSWGSDALGKAASYYKEIQDLENELKTADRHMIDVWEGTQEAYESEGATVVEWLKKLFNQGEEQTKEQKGIKSDSSKIRQLNEQEEELGWLKAFSDRQIMSSYNSMTSNSRTINLNGVSQNTMAEAYRRNRSTIPSRAAL